MKYFINLIAPIIDWLGTLSLPYADKGFNIDHYDRIHEQLKGHDYAIGLVSTSGHFSNLMIKFANILCKDKRKFQSKYTHTFIWNKDRVIEAVGTGLRECSLLKAIGQRDYVKIRIPNQEINPLVQEFACEYLNKRVSEDKENNIEYDTEHNLKDERKLDCSGAVYSSLNYGFKKTNQEEKMKEIYRFGMETWAPADAEFSTLFNTIYDNGFIIIE